NDREGTAQARPLSWRALLITTTSCSRGQLSSGAGQGHLLRRWVLLCVVSFGALGLLGGALPGVAQALDTGSVDTGSTSASINTSGGSTTISSGSTTTSGATDSGGGSTTTSGATDSGGGSTTTSGATDTTVAATTSGATDTTAAATTSGSTTTSGGATDTTA